MTEPAPSPSSSAPVSAASPAPGPAPSPAPVAAAAARPEWLPEAHWDAQTNAIKPEFGAHYVEVAKFHQSETERRASLPKKPDEYKVELPSDFKIPEGVPLKPEQLKINDKDPRIPLVRAFAHEFGLPQEAIGKLVALDAQMQIESYNAETARLADENKKLGDRASDRVAAVATWAKGLKDRGEIADAELAAIHEIATSAAGVTVLEKLMAKVNGSVPGNRPENPPQPQPKTLAERMWPGGFNPNPQAKAS